MARGYDGATMRAVAAKAGVDVSAVSYHFGSKGGLFAAVAVQAIGPTAVLRAALDGDPARLAERLVVLVTRAWEAPDTGPLLVDLVHAAMADATLMGTLCDFLEHEVVAPLIDRWGDAPAARDQATAVLTMLVGVVFGRYVMGLPALSGQAAHRYRWAVAAPMRGLVSARRPR